ncbi:RNA-directed DNA polymerase, eukaryota [Tanacetum coccineum]
MMAQNKVKDKLMRQLLEWDKRAENGLINASDPKSRIRWAIEGDENTRFFHSILKFKEENNVRTLLSSSLFCTLSLSDANFLDSHISLNEIKGVVRECEGSKAPGPDGFNFNFVKSYWEIIKHEFWDCIKYFESPGCVYKVISKILANRLAKVIAFVISPNQSAFIAGRQILDGCLIANEIIRIASIEDLKLLLFKVDFEKAFDKACDKGLYKGVSLAESGSNLSLLQFADDALFFGEWSRVNASLLIHILKCFELASGLKVNLSKSRIVRVGVSFNEVEAVANSLGFSYDSLPFSYLSLPIGKRMKSCDGWSDVINRFRDRLSSWKAKSLSIGSKITLVKSVIGNLPIYYLSLFKAPLKIINILESIRSHFFWGFKESQKGISWVKWNSILPDFENGGLGVSSLLAKNLGLLAKWKRHFLVEKNALWRTVIKGFKGIDGGFRSPPNSFGM